MVFAQLLIGGTNHGIHGLLVPIRNKQVRRPDTLLWAYVLPNKWLARFPASGGVWDEMRHISRAFRSRWAACSEQGTADSLHWPRALRPAALQGMRPMPGVRIEDMGHKMG